MDKKLIICASVLAAISQTSLAKQATSLKVQFKQSYAAYNQALNEGDFKAITAAAKDSYELGCQLFDRASDNCITLTTNYAMVTDSLDVKTKLYFEALDSLAKEYGDNSIPTAQYAISILSSPNTDVRNEKILYQRAYSTITGTAKVLVESDPAAAGTLYTLAAEALQNKIYNDEIYLKGYQILSKQLPDDHPVLIRSRAVAAVYYLRSANKSKAQELSLEAIDVFDKIDNTEYVELEIRARSFAFTEFVRLGESDKADIQLKEIAKLQPWTENAQPIYRVEPRYPERAVRALAEGWVELKFDISEDGRPVHIEIVNNSSPPYFNRSAKKALEQWRYVPKIEGGKPVKVKSKLVRLDFTLKG